MPVQDRTQSSVDLTDDPVINWIIGSTDAHANAAPSPPSNAPRIPKVPQTVRVKHDYYEKHYVPKFVSIGPYHFGNTKLELFEKRKPDFAMKLFSYDKIAIKSLYEKLAEPEMVRDLRSFYEQQSLTNEQRSNMVFTKMMLLDGCFILYFIVSLYVGWIRKDFEFKSNEVFFIRRDLYLLENQIPFKVLKEVMKLAKSNRPLQYLARFIDVSDLLEFIKPFIDMSSIVERKEPKRKWLDRLKIICSSNEERGTDQKDDQEEPDHLLDALHGKHSKACTVKAPTETTIEYNDCNFRSVTELVDAGISFKPIKDTLSMINIEFVKRWWGFSANVKLPPVAVSDYTRPMLLNMMAYETYRCSLFNSWVTSYVYLLGSLINDAKDVKILRKAWVLQNLLPSDQDVVDLFQEIATNFVENTGYGYWEAKYKIQRHYDSWRNTLFSQLKNEYVKSPWAFLALLGALIALFLTAVQTYYTVWSPESPCDELCKFLKINHHL